MRITVYFQFKGDKEPAAVTGVEDHVTDLLLPLVGDIVSHTGADGRAISGVVSRRSIDYRLGTGHDVSGEVAVTLLLERELIH